MKLICSKKVLVENIALVSRAATSRSQMQILECVLLIADGDGFRMLCNDLELCIESGNIEAEIIEVGSIALDCKVFFDIVRRLPGDEVEITLEANNMTIIRSLKSEYKILGQTGDEFPKPPVIEKEQPYAIAAGQLRDLIRQTNFSVSTDDTKPLLTGELIEIDENYIKMIAVDGFRISLRQFKLDTPNKEPISAVIPGKTLNEIARILEDDTIATIYFADRSLLFELEGCTITSRLIEGDFIKYENMLSKDFITKVLTDRNALIDSVERATLITKDAKKNPVRLKLEDGRLIITSNSELGIAYDELAVMQDGQNLELSFNPRFITDVLKALDDDKVELNFATTSPTSPCTIKVEGSEDYNYLILPTRR